MRKVESKVGRSTKEPTSVPSKAYSPRRCCKEKERRFQKQGKNKEVKTEKNQKAL